MDELGMCDPEVEADRVLLYARLYNHVAVLDILDILATDIAARAVWLWRSVLKRNLEELTTAEAALPQFRVQVEV